MAMNDRRDHRKLRLPQSILGSYGDTQHLNNITDRIVNYSVHHCPGHSEVPVIDDNQTFYNEVLLTTNTRHPTCRQSPNQWKSCKCDNPPQVYNGSKLEQSQPTVPKETVEMPTHYRSATKLIMFQLNKLIVHDFTSYNIYIQTQICQYLIKNIPAINIMTSTPAVEQIITSTIRVYHPCTTTTK